jgi:hypothetical protein
MCIGSGTSSELPKKRLQTFRALHHRNFGIAQNGVGATTITLLQTRVPPQMRGRVMSLNILLIMGVRPLGDFPASGLIALVGGPLTVLICASVVGLYSLYLLIARPVIRSL